MSEKLSDPSKAAHEIIEVLEDGDAIRNDGVRLTAANKNPWYVLATIYGEQEEGANWYSYDEELAAKNRRAWNLWICQNVSDAERVDLAKKAGLDIADLAPLRDAQKAKAEMEDIKNRFLTRRGKQIEQPTPDDDVNFSNTIFVNYFCFEKMIITANANFSDTVFRGESTFVSAVFMSGALFISTVFSKDTYFNFATFSAGVWFNLTKFKGFVSFFRTEFPSIADFSSSSFKFTTIFSEAHFLTQVPEFHATELYDDTVFSCRDQDQGSWPPLKGEGIMPAADQKRAYNRLRLFMSKSLQIDEEQFFHRMEMRCKAVLAKWRHKPLYWLFAAFSDYGNSVWRPVAWGAFSVVAAAIFMLWWQGVFAFTPQNEAGFDWTLGLLKDGDVWAKPREAFGWSISNTMPFLGSGKYFTDDEFTKDISAWLKFVGWGQTLFGYILLFFLGLGLRNRFRLR